MKQLKHLEALKVRQQKIKMVKNQNASYLQIAKVVLIHCNVINSNHQQN